MLSVYIHAIIHMVPLYVLIYMFTVSSFHTTYPVGYVYEIYRYVHICVYIYPYIYTYICLHMHMCVYIYMLYVLHDNGIQTRVHLVIHYCLGNVFCLVQLGLAQKDSKSKAKPSRTKPSCTKSEPRRRRRKTLPPGSALFFFFGAAWRPNQTKPNPSRAAPKKK